MSQYGGMNQGAERYKELMTLPEAEVPKGSRLTTIRRFGQPDFRSRFEGPNPGCFSCRWGPLNFCRRDKGGGVRHKKAWGCNIPTFLELFCFLWFALLFGFHNDDTEKSKETIATPPETGFPAVPCSGAMRHALHRPPGGRYRRYLSLREGSEQDPLSPRASSCRIGPRRQGFASPLRALDGRSDPKDALLTRGKGGCGSGLRTYQPRKAGGFLVSDSSRGADRPRTSIEEAPIFRSRTAPMVAPSFP